MTDTLFVEQLYSLLFGAMCMIKVQEETCIVKTLPTAPHKQQTTFFAPEMFVHVNVPACMY